MARAKYEKPAELRREWEGLGDPAAPEFVDALASARMETIARPWQPYRTVASWYLWRSLET